MVNSFTRAAGAAERVLSLYDLEPDIDPDGGLKVETCVNKWDVSHTNPLLSPLSLTASHDKPKALTHPSLPPPLLRSIDLF